MSEYVLLVVTIPLLLLANNTEHCVVSSHKCVIPLQKQSEPVKMDLAYDLSESLGTSSPGV